MAAENEGTTTATASPLETGYWAESARPWVSLLFVIPMLMIYELGVLALGPSAIRNGVDVWLRQFLIVLGFGQYFLLPLLTCGILLAWHHLREHPWGVSARVFPLMLAESAALGLILLFLAHWQASLMRLEVLASFADPEAMATGRKVVAYFGAGIYEELLFRLMLVPALWYVFVLFCFPRQIAIVLAVFTSSLIFSAAHYDFFIPGGDPFSTYTFLFRFTAGILFAAIFATRGFGIAAGSHALYDVFVAFS